MKKFKIALSLLVVLVITLSAAVVFASDFDWMDNMSVRAEADRNGFRVQLATRFKVGNADVDVVIGNVDRPADAYMVMRLGEMSGKPVDFVLKQYQANKGKGWGVLAKSLGIKPGSPEFKALKAGHDLNGDTTISKGGKKNKGKGRK